MFQQKPPERAVFALLESTALAKRILEHKKALIDNGVRTRYPIYQLVSPKG